jgi:hypothetical protein
MSANPFTYGNPISDPARFYGREREVEQVFSRLRNAEFESSSLVGERRIGKTSLLNYLAHPHVRRKYGLDPDKHIFVYVDLEMVDRATTPARLWQRLLRQMARHCQSDQVKQVLAQVRQADAIDNFALEDVFDSVDEQDHYVVLLLDEFENVTENSNFGPDFFYGLRSLAIHHHLSLITSSRRELIELCHSEAIRSSPFFNIFANINVGLFSEGEARQFITRSLEGTGIGFSEADLDTVFRLAGYHPYFLQAACYFLFESYSKNLSPQERAKFVAKEFREEAAPHLADYWHTTEDHQRIVLLLLALLEQGRASRHALSVGQLQDYYARADQTLSHLEKRGLVVSRPDGYTLLSAALAEWIVREIAGNGMSGASDQEPEDELSHRQLGKLRQGLVDHFSDDELRTLCFDLGADYENLPAEGKAGKVRELVAHLERTARLTDLIEACRKRRPNVAWDDALKAPRAVIIPAGSQAERLLADILPRISAKYRGLIAGWVSQSWNPAAVAGLFQSVPRLG